jgi:hypothetical protein
MAGVRKLITYASFGVLPSSLSNRLTTSSSWVEAWLDMLPLQASASLCEPTLDTCPVSDRSMLSSG